MGECFRHGRHDGFFCPTCETIESQEKSAEKINQLKEAIREATEEQKQIAEETQAQQERIAEETFEENKRNIENAPRLRATRRADRAWQLLESSLVKDAILEAAAALEDDHGCIDALIVSTKGYLLLKNADQANIYFDKCVRLLGMGGYYSIVMYYEVIQLVENNTPLYDKSVELLRGKINEAWQDSKGNIRALWLREFQLALDILQKMIDLKWIADASIFCESLFSFSFEKKNWSGCLDCCLYSIRISFHLPVVDYQMIARFSDLQGADAIALIRTLARVRENSNSKFTPEELACLSLELSKNLGQSLNTKILPEIEKRAAEIAKNESQASTSEGLFSQFRDSLFSSEQIKTRYSSWIYFPWLAGFLIFIIYGICSDASSFSHYSTIDTIIGWILGIVCIAPVYTWVYFIIIGEPYRYILRERIYRTTLKVTLEAKTKEFNQLLQQAGITTH